MRRRSRILAAVGGLVVLGVVILAKGPWRGRTDGGRGEAGVGLPAAATNLSLKAAREGIEGALRDGRGYLYAAQRDGQWGSVLPAGPQFAREVPIVLRALRACGEDMADPRIAPYVHRVSNWEVNSYWALNERIELHVHLDVHPALWKDDLSALLNPKQEYVDGLWMKDPTFWRRSLELGAVMESAAALAEKGVEVPKGFWIEANRYWRERLAVFAADATSDNYSFLEALRFTMLTDDWLEKASAGEVAPGDALVQGAIQQLPQRYDRIFTHMNRFTVIELLGNVMRDTGRRYIGDHDWFAECVAFLLAAQREDGSWGNGMADTARAMMFLNRGRSRMIVYKLHYHDDASDLNWDVKPNDLKHLTKWLSGAMKRPVDWVALGANAPVEEWTQGRVLFIGGEGAMSLTDAQMQKLKSFIEKGGVVVGTLSEGGEFGSSFETLGGKLFPEAKFRVLEKDHWVYSGRDDSANVVASGVGDGKREFMVLIRNNSVARRWELNEVSSGAGQQAAQMVQNLVVRAGGGQIGGEFAGGEKGWDKFMRAAIMASAKAAREADSAQYPPLTAMMQTMEKQGDAARVLKSVTLALIGNSTDPDSVPPLRALREALRTTDTTLNVDPLELGQWKLQRYETAWVNGKLLLRMGSLQRMEVKRFIEIGGTLIVTSEDGKLTEALERQMVRVLAEGAVVFGAPETNEVGLAKSVRVGRVSGRRAVVIAGDAKASDDVLLALLAGRGK